MFVLSLAVRLTLRYTLSYFVPVILIKWMNEWMNETSFRSSSPIILVLLTPSADTQLQGETPSAGAKNMGWTIRDLPQSHRLCRKRYEIGPLLLWNVNKKSWVVDRSVSVPMTLSDLERRNTRVKCFRLISLITFVPFDPERPNSTAWHVCWKVYF